MWRNVTGDSEDSICGVALAVAEPVPDRPAPVLDIADDPFDSGAPSYLAFGLPGDAALLEAAGLVRGQSFLTVADLVSEAGADGDRCLQDSATNRVLLLTHFFSY
jgi:hypothetical protein